MSRRLSPEAEPYFSFVLKTVGGALGFLVVFFVAVVINLAVTSAERVVPLPLWLVLSADWIERGLWAADVVGFASFVLRELVESIRGMWWRRSDG